MYRYRVDNAVTYTSEDLSLFRESPFAAWMERLTLENPDHGIPPDAGSSPPQETIQRQDDVADMLRAEGRDVCLVDWEQDEAWRRGRTLEAMRSGVDFIVNGQLALGPLSSSVNLLMRTSGYSELGSFLYIPCDTQARSTAHSTFRLCFLADLLHSLQGQLPPRMLIIRGGSDLVPLHTDDHIYYYRAVKHRFMEAMRIFRKHAMPDPAESARFGRWSDCANEVLKQRALRDEAIAEEEVAAPAAEAPQTAQPMLAATQGSSAYDLDDIRPRMAAPLVLAASRSEGQAAAAASEPNMSGEEGGGTLAEQALKLVPGAYRAESARRRPGFTPNLAWVADEPVEEKTAVDERQTLASEDEQSPDPAPLEEVVFQEVVPQGDGPPEAALHEALSPEVARREAVSREAVSREAVPHDRRRSDQPDRRRSEGDRRSADHALHNLQFIGSSGDKAVPRQSGEKDAARPSRPHPLDSAGFSLDADSVVDLDYVGPSSAGQAASSASLNTAEIPADEDGPGEREGSGRSDQRGPAQAFSDSLITNELYTD